MRIQHTQPALCLIPILFACSAAQEHHESLPKPASTEAVDPMASFARFVGGEWKVTLASGESPSHAWCWGPGRYSMRKMTDASDSVDNAWAGEVLYWHPGRKEICTLSVHGDIPAVGRGVAVGTIRFEGDRTDAVVDLEQPRGPRKLGQTQVFAGADKYHEVLLEDAGAGLRPLAEWDFTRVPARAERPRTVEPAQVALSKPLQVLEPLVGGTWEGRGLDVRSRSTIRWIPSLEVVSARVSGMWGDSLTARELDAYFYMPIRTDGVRCLALSSEGGVYEGDVTVIDGAVQLELKGYEGERVVERVVRFEIEKDGTLRQRDWSIEGTQRTLLREVRHTRVEAK